ncbi:beta-ketoacyl synthase [Cercophora scortea]|uniref:Beta-ketoacyl synthase n=1 Tax=Cercophora scortea TaxID=314031 RepID=A0AAE0I6M7_9PEZI|nr:beta-ketoacyl synthase [Cercophora scortea]
MTDQLKLCIFGDQTCDLRPHWKELFQVRDNPAVEDFLVKSYNAVRNEIYNLPVEARNAIPRFTSLNDLILSNQTGARRCLAIDTATSCIYELATFIGQADAWYHEGGELMALGLCLGGLASAAVCTSKTTISLIPRAVDAVVAAFRTGLQATETAKNFVPWSSQEEFEGNWSILLLGPTAPEALAKYLERTALPSAARPYISAYSSNTITVSGSPSSLARLVESEELKGIRSKKLPVYGPLHAPHLYTDANIDEIVKGLGSNSTDEREEHLTFLSSTGVMVKGPDFASLLRAAVDAIVAQPMRFPELLDQLQTHITTVSPKSVDMFPIATTVDRMIQNTFKNTPVVSLLSIPPPPATQQQTETSPPNPKTPKLAIIGMAGRFPGGANSTEAFWDILHEGLDVHKSVPPRRWDPDTHVDLTGKKKNTGAVPWGCWIDDAGHFDARFFSISPREAPQIDPAQRLALMTVQEAIEMSGIVADTTPSTRPDRVGVFYGVTANDWAETNSTQDIDTYLIPGGNRAFIPGRINYFYKFSGPSYAVDTACSSALSAIHIACNSLWRGDIDTAIAGGTNIMTNPDPHAGLDRGHFLSRTGNCKTFDDGADGYCRGEGVGTVIIKRLDDAIADNDPILAVILDTYTNHSSESESITRPHAGAQRAIFGKLLNQGVVDPYSVSYIEMHGTGTQVGDATEMSSVLSSFAPPLSEVPRARTKEEALFLGSAKANIGHGEASSGSSALIKVLLMMQKNIIPPNCGIKTKLNRKFPTDLADRNVHIPLKPAEWKRSSDPLKPRRALVNNFGAAGGNTAILLEDAPLKPECTDVDPRSVHLVAVSAKSAASIQGNLKSLLKYLKENPEVSLGKLSYTTTARRTHHQHRVMLSGSSVKELSTQIETALQSNAGATRPKTAPKYVFTFTGQGAQFPGMGKELYAHIGVFRKEMNRLDQVCQSLGFPSMLPVIGANEEDDMNVFSPAAVQLASICMQIALGKVWEAWGIVPTAVVGHSLGEYAALNYAGVLSDADTLFLVGKRAEFLQSKCTRDTHAMLVVRGSVDEITAALGDVKDSVEFACINSAVETVLAGTNEAIAAATAVLTEAGRKSTLLKVPYAFHSSQLDPMLSDLEQAAQSVTYSKPKLPVLCPLDGSIVEDVGVFGPQYLVRHSRQPVNMISALLAGRTAKFFGDSTMAIEIGPHPAMGGMVRAVLGSQVPTLASSQRGRSAWSVLATTLKQMYTAGATITWTEYHAGFKASHEVLSLPTYSWEYKDFWIDYRNDWSLRKGDPAIIQVVGGGGPRLESTTIHRVVEETETAGKVHMVVEADIARPDLSPIVQGHEVDGIPLCTPSVYAEIALSLGTYFLQRYRPGHAKNVVDVTNMEIFKAMILRAGSIKQLMQAHSEVDWSSDSAVIKFMSFDSKQKLQLHSQCKVIFKDASLRETLQKEVPKTKQKLQKLRDGVTTGEVSRYTGAMCYRAIRPLARFHPDFKAGGEVLLNSNTLEAGSRLTFGTVKNTGSFHTHPGVIDALTQACGFIMNCNDHADPDGDVFMNHGWGSLQIYEPINHRDEYTTYTRMVEGKDDLWYGDIAVLDSKDRVVAWFGHNVIQKVQRRVLSVILSIESGVKSQKPAPAAKPTPAGSAIAHAKTAPKAPPVVVNPSRSQSVEVTKALEIVAEESGLALTDLTDSTVFADIGIDSLLGLTISARFKEELDQEVDFIEYATVGELKAFFGHDGGASHPESSSGTMTPTSSSDHESLPSSPPSTNGDVEVKHKLEVSPVGKFDFKLALQIIAEESGVALEDLTDDTVFADAGVDSLLSLVIVSRFRDELELDIKHESLFLECPTVGILRTALLGDESSNQVAVAEEKVNGDTPLPKKHSRSPAETAALAAREKAVDAMVAKYTAGYAGPGPAVESAPAPKNDEKVVVVTGASGSLGSHVVYHLAQLPDVKTVICLNRNNREEPVKRQIKAMRDKGIRFPEALKHKLVVLQTDTSKPMLGLEPDLYERVVRTATHLVHSAWPMSGKRAFDGFESQFQVMQNLIKLACDVASQRPASFKFSFLQVSSIGVVGLYRKEEGTAKQVFVPEERFGIDCILNNGYGDAKWGCERMLDETLHKSPDRFRPMVVRLGQIAGSKTSGYWNPMEHFGFVMKSSQTLGALPDVPGSLYWTPVNDMADTLIDLVLSDQTPHRFYHLENPKSRDWKEVNAILADAIGIKEMIPFDEWVKRVAAAPQRGNPAATLMEFLDDNYLRMSYGGLVLDAKNTLEHSKSLRAVQPVSEEVIRKYIHIWKEIGFLNKD